MSSGWQLKRLKQTRCCFAVAMSMISISVSIIITTVLCTANVLAFIGVYGIYQLTIMNLSLLCV